MILEQPENAKNVAKRVLVADDSALQRRILSKILEARGYHVTQATDGAEALEMCRSAQFDVIISDWMMPQLTGPGFCQKFRAMEDGTYTYFVLLTTKGDAADIAFGLEAGADDFLTKPVDGSELQARLGAGHRIVEMQRELFIRNAEIAGALGEIQRLYDILDRDLQQAKTLQMSLLPEPNVNFGRADISLGLRSSGYVGGDLVGYFKINENQVGLFGLDVSGHGVSSALMTARLAGYLSAGDPVQNVAIESKPGRPAAVSPERVVRRLNDMMFSEIATEHYFTILYGVIDTETGDFSFCQAGHPHPILQRSAGSAQRLGTGGLPVGLIEGASYELSHIQLYAGDWVFIGSDGVTEALNKKGEMFAEHGLCELLQRSRALSGDRLLERVVDEVTRFTGSNDLEDDLSAISLGFRAAQ